MTSSGTSAVSPIIGFCSNCNCYSFGQHLSEGFYCHVCYYTTPPNFSKGDSSDKQVRNNSTNLLSRKEIINC